MAAEVDFGDLELFEAFDHPEESIPKPVHTRFKDDDGDEEDENGVGDAELRERLRQQYHQEIEEFVSNLVKRFEEQQKNDVEKTSFNLLPQPSSVMLEEDHKVEESCAIKNNKEAFSVVGSVLYFTNFCLDKLGQPLLNENPQLTEGWEIPKPKPHCFNCGSEEHQMKDCPMPRNAARISEKRKEYMDACGEANGADGEAEAGEAQQNKSVTYDLSKLVNYPGFNISTPRGIPDEWRVFGSIPMQACQQKDVFASYLTSNFQVPSVRSGGKRSSSQSSPSSPKKQKKESGSATSPADMELDSDAEVPHSSPSSEAFQFQPPLPPGTPPPLPRGTPPPIFTPPLPKGTPPLTPSDSPQTRTASAAMDEDSLTLEELEEQQRRIWAALEQAESVNSDSDIPVDTPLTGNSVASSPCPNELDLPVPEGRTSEKQMMPDEPEVPDTCTKKSEVERSLSPDSEPTLLCQKEKEESAQADSKDAPLDNGSVVSDCDIRNGGSQKRLHVDTSPSTATTIHSPVPDMSKFATGITPFEFENMAESTGMYLRIRNLLKNSPRNQQKNKKASE
ncbi:hypothetical protein GH733_005172 [Mirounga leonina]|nr:hypothetical protein GH733_005172 [Mirounga leonina]